MIDNQIEQKRQIVAKFVSGGTRSTLDCRPNHHREIKLFLGCAKLIKKFKNLVDHPIGSRAITINLVHHQDGVQSVFECFLGHKSSLRHGAFDRVNQQQHGVDHRKNSLNLTAKVCVARRVNDIDAHPFPIKRRILGKDGDTSLTLQFVGVH